MKKKIFSLAFSLALWASNVVFAANPGEVITLDLSQPTNPTTFNVDANGVWTETYNDVDYTFIEFNSPFSFSHIIPPSASYGGYYWDGFTYSKNGDNTNYFDGGSSQSWVGHQWGNMAGGGIKTDTQGNVMKDGNGIVLTDSDTPYLVAYWGYWMDDDYYQNNYLPEPTHNLQTIFTDGNTYEAVGMYVNNHPWPYYGNINGDGFARALDQEGDYFKLIIHGLDENYENNGKSVEYYLAKYENGQLIQSPDWEWVDLSALGEVGGLYYTLETTDAGMWGPNTAVYFCMDKLQIRVSGTPTKVPDTIADTQLSVYPNPFADYINVKTNTDSRVAIYNISGQCVLNKAVVVGENHIETSALPKGTYILKCGENTIKIIK